MTADPGERIAKLQELFQRVDRQRYQALADNDLARAEERTRLLIVINKSINDLMVTVREKMA